MKRIATVIIITSDLFESWVEVRRNTGDTRLQRRTYPLTLRNYWRAVGMQMRLAGFAPPKENKKMEIDDAVFYCECGRSHMDTIDISSDEYLSHVDMGIFIRRADCDYLEPQEEVIFRNERYIVVKDNA